MEITKTTVIKSSEELTINPGVYYFKRDYEAVVTYRRVELDEKDNYKLTVVVNQEDNISIRYEQSSYDFDYVTESCFIGGEDIEEITEYQFNTQFNNALEFFNQ
jgi:hypothetical protein